MDCTKSLPMGQTESAGPVHVSTILPQVLARHLESHKVDVIAAQPDVAAMIDKHGNANVIFAALWNIADECERQKFIELAETWQALQTDCEPWLWQANHPRDVYEVAKAFRDVRPLLVQKYDRQRQEQICRISLSLAEVEKRLPEGNDLRSAVHWVVAVARENPRSITAARCWWEWIGQQLIAHKARLPEVEA